MGRVYSQNQHVGAHTQAHTQIDTHAHMHKNHIGKTLPFSVKYCIDSLAE